MIEIPEIARVAGEVLAMIAGRSLVGRPVTAEHPAHFLRTDDRQQRAAAAIELTLLQSGQFLFEVRRPGLRQEKVSGRA